MFKTCSDPDFNWVHCLCDSATWVVKEPGKPIGFFYSRLFDDALSQPADLFRRPPGPADASARARRPYGHLGPPRRGGHIRGGKRPVGEQFELGVRPMAISRGVNHRSPHPRVAKSRDSYPLGARLFQRFPSGKRFSIGSRHGGLPVRETPWCRPSGAGSIVGEAPIRHLPPGADLYG